MEGIARSALGDDAVLLSKTRYYQTGKIPKTSLLLKSTTFGVRDLGTNEWNFYYQSFGQDSTGRKLDHYGCHQLM